jgi:hypothetical protein
MKRDRAPLWLGSIAAFGVFVSHLVAFWLAEPDAHHRLELLEETGHSYWSFATPVATGLLLAGLFSFTKNRLREKSLTRVGVVPTSLRLAALQSGGFIALEMLERITSGGAPLDLLGDRTVLFGIAVQAVIAFIGALLLVGLANVVARIRRLVDRLPSRDPGARRRAQLRRAPVAAAVAAGGRGLRGPPATC